MFRNEKTIFGIAVFETFYSSTQLFLKMRFSALLFSLLILSLFAFANAKKITPEECKGMFLSIAFWYTVCIDVVNGISETISEKDKKDVVDIETKISAYCKQKTLSAEQKKIVWICFWYTNL